MKNTSRTFVSLMLIALLSACAGGISRTTINGNTTYKQDGKEISEEQVAAGNSVFANQIRQEQRQIEVEKEQKQRQAKFRQALKNAPHRKASEPVSIALLKPIVAPGPSIDKAKLGEYWRTPFENQKKLPLVSEKKIDKSMKSNRSALRQGDWFESAMENNVPGDVYVQLIIKSDGVLAKNKQTKEIKLVSALIYRAEIASPYLDEKVVIEETVLNIFTNVQQLDKLGNKVREAVKSKIRPKLPSVKWIRQQQSAGLEAQL
jgi:hypothetical protein